MPRRKQRSALQVVAKELEVEDLRIRLAGSFTEEVGMLELALNNLTNLREIIDNQIDLVKDRIEYAKDIRRRAAKRLPEQALRTGEPRRARGMQSRKKL